MTYKEKTKAICASILLIAKNATVIIPIIEGIIYTIIDSVKALKRKPDSVISQDKATDSELKVSIQSAEDVDFVQKD